MLTVRIGNKSQLAAVSDYDVKVFINFDLIADGEVLGHTRADGWRDLLRKIADAPGVVDIARSMPRKAPK